MASVHVLALSHVVGLAVGLAFLAAMVRRMMRGSGTRVRSEYSLPRRRPLRMLFRLGVHLLRGSLRLAASMVLALATPIGVLRANRRYPLVAPVLTPFEQRLAALGHRMGTARCFPLLVWSLWLVRCTGCRQRALFREVPSVDGTALELKVLGRSAWRTGPCPAEYLTAHPQSSTPVAPSVQSKRRVRRAHPGTGQHAARASAPHATPPLSQPPAADRTA